LYKEYILYMTILDNNNSQEHDLYIRAMKSLDKANKVSEHTKVPETKEEKEFMHEIEHEVHKNCFYTPMTEEQYKRIFKA
jgi:hypothetical protein